MSSYFVWWERVSLYVSNHPVFSTSAASAYKNAHVMNVNELYKANSTQHQLERLLKRTSCTDQVGQHAQFAPSRRCMSSKRFWYPSHSSVEFMVFSQSQLLVACSTATVRAETQTPLCSFLLHTQKWRIQHGSSWGKSSLDKFTISTAAISSTSMMNESETKSCHSTLCILGLWPALFW